MTMMKKLEAQGYAHYFSHRGCTFTVGGVCYGLNILCRHRLLETFLDLGRDTAHQEAERLEHTASDLLIDSISERMGNPTEDPNGNLIPTWGQSSFTVDEAVGIAEVEVDGQRKTLSHKALSHFFYDPNSL